MTLAAGTRLGPYEIAAKLGEGGMGEVWRATDTRLKREVAIKVLPTAFVEDAERLARFEREAQLLAQLHHPHIASVFGLEESGGVRALVMELVEGPTLDERMAKGALPLDEALPIAREIALALEEAHAKGIVHRDLKPQNVKLAPDGKVKVLDFGLAKAMDAGGATGSAAELARSPTLLNSPTLTAAGTQLGVILGTAAYMAPEQARGGAVDKRADVWAFGVVLFEMLAGRTLFAAETVSDTLAGVLKNAIDLGELPASTPPAIRRLLRRCLERNPKNRLHDIADARIVLDEVLSGETAEAEPAPAARAGFAARALFAAAAVAAVVGGLAGWLLARAAAPAPTPRLAPRLSVALPAGVRAFTDQWPGRMLALSPDGRELVFVCRTFEGGSYFSAGRLCRRALDRFEIEAIAGTEGARQPFFSPDGRWVGFFTQAGGVRKVSLATGKVLPIAAQFDAAQWAFGSWGEDDRIVFASFSSGLLSVAADGGEVATLVPFEGEWLEAPEHLPGTRTVLFRARGAGGARVEAYDLDRRERRIVLENASQPRFVAPDHLLFMRGGVPMTVAFDPATATPSGSPAPVEEVIAIDGEMSTDPTPQVAFSREGTLAYLAPIEPPEPETELFWIDRAGRETPATTLPAIVAALDLTADGRLALLATRHGDEVRFLLFDLERGTTTQVATSRRGSDITTPTLLPGDREFVFMSSVVERAALERTSLDGERDTRTLFELDCSYAAARSVSTDGRIVMVSAYRAGQWSDIWSVDLASETPRPEPYLATPASEHSPALSPDGHWLAYVSNEDGDEAVYVRSFPGGAGKRRISSESGSDPQWARSGRELFFLTGFSGDGSRGLMSAPIEVSNASELRLGAPRRLFDLKSSGGYDISRPFAATADGSRFLAFRNAKESRTLDLGRAGENFDDLRVVPGWVETLRGEKGAR